MIGRWIIRDQKLLGSNAQRFTGPYTAKLDGLCERVCCSPRKCFGYLCFATGIFFSLALLDMAGDEKGWVYALWAPQSIMVISICLYVFFRYAERNSIVIVGHGYESNSMSTASEVQMMAANPLFIPPDVAESKRLVVNEERPRRDTEEEKLVTSSSDDTEQERKRSSTEEGKSE